jgi:hypothetical protein
MFLKKIKKKKRGDVTTVNEFLPIQNRYHYQNLEFRAIPFKFTWGGWNATYFQTLVLIKVGLFHSFAREVGKAGMNAFNSSDKATNSFQLPAPKILNKATLLSFNDSCYEFLCPD